MAVRFQGIEGRPIRISFRSGLAVSSRELLFNTGRGQPVHAASFIRERKIILEPELFASEELARILVHELFHFVWVRLGNPRRLSYEQLVRIEVAAGARGELGWSAEIKKCALNGSRGMLWRAYLCESFCDTAAFLFAGCNQHAEFTLAGKWRRKRAEWFEECLGGRVLSI